MDIYIKLKKKATLYKKAAITVGDVAEIVAPPEVLQKIKDVVLFCVNTADKRTQNFAVSITDAIKAVETAAPGENISSIGETDAWVQYIAKEPKPNKLVKWLKVAAVSLVLFVGSSTAIMSFHADGEIPQVFRRYYQLFFGAESTNPLIITIPYAIGIALGIIIFYNHMLGKKVTDDPTPLEVELEMYDKDVTDTMVDLLNQRKENDE